MRDTRPSTQAVRERTATRGIEGEKGVVPRLISGLLYQRDAESADKEKELASFRSRVDVVNALGAPEGKWLDVWNLLGRISDSRTKITNEITAGNMEMSARLELIQQHKIHEVNELVGLYENISHVRLRVKEQVWRELTVGKVELKTDSAQTLQTFMKDDTIRGLVGEVKKRLDEYLDGVPASMKGDNRARAEKIVARQISSYVETAASTLRTAEELGQVIGTLREKHGSLIPGIDSEDIRAVMMNVRNVDVMKLYQDAEGKKAIGTIFMTQIKIRILSDALENVPAAAKDDVMKMVESVFRSVAQSKTEELTIEKKLLKVAEENTIRQDLPGPGTQVPPWVAIKLHPLYEDEMRKSG